MEGTNPSSGGGPGISPWVMAVVVVAIIGVAGVLGGHFAGWFAGLGALSSLVSLIVGSTARRQSTTPLSPARSSGNGLLAAALIGAAAIVAAAVIVAGSGGDDSTPPDEVVTTAPLTTRGDDSATSAPSPASTAGAASTPTTPTAPTPVDLMDRVVDAEDGHFCVATFIASDRSFRGSDIRGAGCLGEPTGLPGRLRIALAEEFAIVTMTFGLCDGAPPGEVPVAIAVQPGRTSEVVVSPSSPAVDAVVATSGAEQLELSMVVPDDTCFVLASALGTRAA